MALNGEFNTKLPFIGSHEPAGIIEEVGSNVMNFQRGERVGCINFDSVCGELVALVYVNDESHLTWFE